MNIQTEKLQYRAGVTPLHGYAAWDADAAGPCPGVLLLHEWWGHDEYVQRRAREVAALGYHAFALDMYGEGRVAKTPEEAGAWMNEILNTPGVVPTRFKAALTTLTSRAGVDGTRVAALGYCMGGAIALEMARQGLDLRAAVAYHPGALITGTTAREGVVRARILVCIGEADPFVSAEQRSAFQEEMRAAGVDLEYVSYPGVQHGFTVPAASNRGKTYGLPLAHDEAADQDSWGRTVKLLAAAFA
jgi:dienelactone hydrolase